MLIGVAKELENGKLLSSIVIAEARRVKAINEDGVDVEAYDAMHEREISALRIRSFRLPRIEFSTEREFRDFVKDTTNNGGVFFNDPRCYEYLRDVITECVNDFGWL